MRRLRSYRLILAIVGAISIAAPAFGEEPVKAPRVGIVHVGAPGTERTGGTAGLRQGLADRGYVDRYDYAIQTLADVPFNVWREYDPEDTLRFYALRLRELGIIKSSPQKVIAEATDWRFLNELKRELKG